MEALTIEAISKAPKIIDYRERLIRKIKEKTGRMPDITKIEDTVLRWVEKMKNGGSSRQKKEIGSDIFSIEYHVPIDESNPVRYCLLSNDELQTLKEKIDKKPRRTNGLFDRAKWMARSTKGSGQSPVNIGTRSAKSCWLKPFDIEGLFSDQSCTMINDGHTLRIFLDRAAYLSEGPLFGEYEFDHLHYHWSENGSTGTEHAIDGKRYAMEAHFVFKAASCSGYRRLVRKAQCKTFCVIGLLFKQAKGGPFYQTFSFVNQVIEPNKKIYVGYNCLQDFRAAFASSEYYNYAGSLTTPPYSEDVEWIVLKRILPISKKQVDNMRALKSHHAHQRIGNNVRPLQPLGVRQVISSITRPGQVFCTGHDLEDCVCEF